MKFILTLSTKLWDASKKNLVLCTECFFYFVEMVATLNMSSGVIFFNCTIYEKEFGKLCSTVGKLIWLIDIFCI